MKRQFFTIPCELPSLNQFLDAGKAHWSRYAKLKKEYSTLISILARLQLKPVTGRVSMDFHWFCKDRRRDPDNVSSAKKFVLDGLTDAGILPDDSWRWVVGFSDHFEIDKNSPRVEITIDENVN